MGSNSDQMEFDWGERAGLSRNGQVAPMRYEVHNNDEIFETLSEDWDSLISADRSSTVFQSFRWVCHMWKMVKSPHTKLCLVTLYGPDDHLRAIAPLYIESSLFPIRVRTLKFIGQGPSDYIDVIVSHRENEESALRTVGEWMQKGEEDFDVIDFSDLPEDSRIIRYQDLLFPDGSFRTKEVGWHEECFYIPVDQSWEDYIRGLSGSFRRQTGRYRRRLEEEHDLEVVVDDGSVDPGKSISALMSLHQLRQESKYERGLFCSEERRSRFTALFREMIAAGELKIISFAIDGAARVALACFEHRSVVCLYSIGSDVGAAYRKYGIGKLILFVALENAFQQGARLVDFTRGGEAYKTRFTSHSKTNSRIITCYSPWKGIVYKRHVALMQWIYSTLWVKKLYWALKGMSSSG